MSCLPAEVTVLGTRYWSALGPFAAGAEQDRGLARKALRRDSGGVRQRLRRAVAC